MQKLIYLVLFLVLGLAGCGGGGTDGTAPQTPKTYYSALKQSNVTTYLHHIVFFNTTTLTNYFGADSVPKGTIITQAFVNDAVLAIPVPDNGTDFIIADPVDPAEHTIVQQCSEYVIKSNSTGTVSGPYASAMTRGPEEHAHIVTFNTITGAIISEMFAQSGPLFANMKNNGDDGIITAPNGIPYGPDLSYTTIVDPLTGEFRIMQSKGQ